MYKTLVKMKVVSKKIVSAKLMVTKEPFGSLTIIGVILFKQENFFVEKNKHDQLHQCQ